MKLIYFESNVHVHTLVYSFTRIPCEHWPDAPRECWLVKLMGQINMSY